MIKFHSAKKAISNIVSIEDLSEEAKDLCEKIYQFIKKIISKDGLARSEETGLVIARRYGLCKTNNRCY